MAKCGWQIQKEAECYCCGTCQRLPEKRVRQLWIWLRVTRGNGEIPSSFRQAVKKERWRWVQVTLICGVQYVSCSFSRRQWSVCDGVVWILQKFGAQSRVMRNLILLECWLWRRWEGTTVAGGVTWSLGVAAVLMVYLKSNVHEGSTHGRIQGGEEYSPRWSLLELCRILCTR